MVAVQTFTRVVSLVVTTQLNTIFTDTLKVKNLTFEENYDLWIQFFFKLHMFEKYRNVL